MMAETVTELAVQAMGARGDGVATAPDGAPDGAPVYLPYVLPGEMVTAKVKAGRGVLDTIVEASADRVEPACKHFGACGGCLLQHWATPAYRDWKRSLVVDALERAGLQDVAIAELVDAHGAGRRRVTLSVEKGKAGFSAHRSHRHVPVEACPVLVPELAQAPEIAQALVSALKLNKPQKVYVLACDTGLDCELPGVDDPELEERVLVADVAEQFDLARVTADGDTLIERRRPVLTVGKAHVTPPPGGFAQATSEGEGVLTSMACDALEGHGTIADLFSGWGSFALRLADKARVLAVDSDRAAIEVLQAAVRQTSGLKPVVARAHDLMREPLTAAELKGVTGVVFDPPRAGAAAQVAELVGANDLTTIVGISCDVGTFARDAAVLVAGGFRLDNVVLVDQFRYTAHVEMAGVFRR